MTSEEKIPTPIAQVIDAGSQKAQYDTEAKKFLSNVNILSRIMKRVVPEFKKMDLEDIKKCILNPTVGMELLDEGLTNITGENAESNIPSEGYVTFDVKFSAKADNNPRGKVIINLEMQRKQNLPYPIESRGVFYCARMISSQKTREFSNSEYGKIKKVYSIWLLFSEDENQEPAITSFSMRQHNDYGEMECLTGADLLEVILIKIPQNVLDYGNKLDSLIRMLGIIFSRKLSSSDKKNYLESDYGIKMSMEDERRLRNMCNLSEGFWEAGKKEGRIEEKLDNIKTALDAGLAEEKIQQIFKVSEEELEEIKQKLYTCV